MPTIPRLSGSDVIQNGDLFAAYIQANGDARKVPASVLLDYIKKNLDQVSFVTQSVVISSNDFNTQVNGGSNIWLILNLTTSFATGTITLPPLEEVKNGQEVLVFASRQVTNFSVDGNGAVAVKNPPSSLAADSSFTLRFNSFDNSWYKIG